jgi:hypothetical protein
MRQPALISPAQANDRLAPAVTVGVTAPAWPAKKAARAPSKRAGHRTEPPATPSWLLYPRLVLLVLGFGNRFFVLLLVLLDLGLGLIGRDILRLGQSISSFIRCSGLLRGSPESAARTAVAAASRSATGSWPPEALRTLFSIVAIGSLILFKEGGSGMDRSLNGPAQGFAGSSKRRRCRAHGAANQTRGSRREQVNDD